MGNDIAVNILMTITITSAVGLATCLFGFGMAIVSRYNQLNSFLHTHMTKEQVDHLVHCELCRNNALEHLSDYPDMTGDNDVLILELRKIAKERKHVRTYAASDPSELSAFIRKIGGLE